MLNVTFHGVRGSTPCPTDGNVRYGANTACVALEVPHQDPIVLDAGTGLRRWAACLPVPDLRATALVSHLHWDHVQGLPFFPPALRPGTRLEVLGPPTPEGSFANRLSEVIRPPWFPVPLAELGADLRLGDVGEEKLEVGRATVTVRPVPHRGPTNGYRIQWEGATVAYVSDHQAPPDRDRVAQSVLELAEGVDLLIHDAQFTVAEWEQRPDWGHCPVEYAVLVAREAGAKRLALFHHDPDRTDDELDRLLEDARRLADRMGVDEVLAAAEGLTVSFDGG